MQGLIEIEEIESKIFHAYTMGDNIVQLKRTTSQTILDYFNSCGFKAITTKHGIKKIFL